MFCRKCGGAMKPSQAFVNVPTKGEPDFPGAEAVTMSYGKDAKLVDCLKCEDCEWSVRSPLHPAQDTHERSDEMREV